MRKLRKFAKPILSVVMSSAFILLMVNVSSACCGPAYQPKLPEKIVKSRK